MTEDATAEWKCRHDEIRHLLGTIGNSTALLRDRHGPIDWGNVGDLTHIRKGLAELAAFANQHGVPAGQPEQGLAKTLEPGDQFMHLHYEFFVDVLDVDYVSPGVMSDGHRGGVRVEWERKGDPAYADDAYWLDEDTPLTIIRKQQEKTVEQPLWITHTFTVPVENMGGQNHGHELWIADILGAAGLWEEVAEDDAEENGGKFEVTEHPHKSHWWVTVTATERALRFLCVLFDLHAEQSPDDPTNPDEANKLERAIAEAKILAGPASPERARIVYEKNGWLTVGKLREAIADKPDDKLVTIYNGSSYQHAEIISDCKMPGEDEEPTVILGMSTEFDSRDI